MNKALRHDRGAAFCPSMRILATPPFRPTRPGASGGRRATTAVPCDIPAGRCAVSDGVGSEAARTARRSRGEGAGLSKESHRSGEAYSPQDEPSHILHHRVKLCFSNVNTMCSPHHLYHVF